MADEFAEYIYGMRVKTSEDGRVWEMTPQSERRERIVRCRDCAYAVERRTESIIGTELVTLTCSGPIQGAYSEGEEVSPDGFCAWGKPREEA